MEAVQKDTGVLFGCQEINSKDRGRLDRMSDTTY